MRYRYGYVFLSVTHGAALFTGMSAVQIVDFVYRTKRWQVAAHRLALREVSFENAQLMHSLRYLPA
jgi:hypothetical protein